MSLEYEFQTIFAPTTDNHLIRLYTRALEKRHRFWPGNWDIAVLNLGNGNRRLWAGADVADFIDQDNGSAVCLWARYMDDYGWPGNYFRNKQRNIIIPPRLAQQPAEDSELFKIRISFEKRRQARIARKNTKAAIAA